MTEQTIFLSALDIADPKERTVYVAAACGADATLRQQVEALLAAHDRSGLFLDEPALEQAAGRAGGPNARTVSADEPAGPDTPTLTSPDSARPGPDGLGFLQPPTRAGALGRLAHYEVLEVLGRGGFGTVLRAFDDRLHRVVAIKVLSPQLATSGQARARFNREARSGAAVRDDHVVNIHAVGPDDEPVPYLVMEYVAGQTLQQKLDRTGPLSVREVLRIGSQIARGLAAAHATGHIHRDVKPSNILLENGVERVKITDFGLARTADDASISHSGVVAGTPMYMAPEQAHGVPIDHRADLFSLGSVLYAMCTGRPPFRATTTMAVLKRVCEEDPRPVREINPEVPDWLAAVIAKLHAKRREDRFQTAKEVADLLGKYLSELQSGGVVTPVDDGRAEVRKQPDEDRIGSLTRRRSPRRRRRVAAAVVGLILTGFLLGAWHFRTAIVESLEGRGTIAFEFDDPELSVFVDDAPVIDWGDGPRQIKVRPGEHRVRAMKHGTATHFVLLTVERDGRHVVNLAPTPQAPIADGFVSLFNGRDLTGWKAAVDHPGPWSVKDGVLRGGGARSILMSAGEYGDFHLRCRARISDGGDSGIFFRADEKVVRNTPHGYEAMINANIQNAPRTGSLEDTFHNYEVGKDPFVKPNEWFTYEIIAEGERVRLKVNDQLTLDWNGADRRQRGRFALQLPNDTTVVEFRSIEVKNLSRPASLDGRWLVESVEMLGKPVPAAEGKFLAREMVFAGDRWGLVQANGTRWEGGLRVHADRVPPQLEVTSSIFDETQGTGRMIYRLDGDRLTLCAGGTEAPTTFTTGPSSPNVLMVLRRAPATESATRLRAFTPGKDRPPLPLRGPAKAVTVVGDAWRIENADQGGNFHVMVAQDLDGLPKDGVLVFRAKVKVEARDKRTWGDLDFGAANQVFPSWDQWPDARARYDGEDAEWTEKEERYPAAEAHKKGTVYLYAGLHADGVLWLKDVELLHLPADKPDIPPLAVAPFDAKQAKGHQEAWAKHVGVDVEVTNSVGMKLRLIPPGEFDMGTSAKDTERLQQYGRQRKLPAWFFQELTSMLPRHRVAISTPFYAGAHEVTIGQFRKFVEATGYRTDAERDGKGGATQVGKEQVQRPEFTWKAPGLKPADDAEPVTHVSLADVAAFCKWLSEKEGRAYRLPTEAEWEHCCRAGTATLFAAGDSLPGDRGNCQGRTGGPTKVGTYPANAFGLYDMHGNVWEWCQDWFSTTYYATSPNADPTGPANGDTRVIRGGAWDTPELRCGSPHRLNAQPTDRDHFLGFRVVLAGDLKARPPAGSWVPLFNGKDLAGWKTHRDQPGDWKVVDGVLIGRGGPSHLFTDRGDFGDFHLRAEVKVNASGDSGVWFRTGFDLPTVSPITGLRYPGGIEAQIIGRPNGDEKNRHTGSIIPIAAAPKALAAADEWFTWR